MKTTALAAVLTALPLGAMCAMGGCWPDAPEGGSFLDASSRFDGAPFDGAVPDAGDGGNPLADADAGPGSDADAGGVDGSDAAEASAQPYRSPTIATGLAFGCHIGDGGSVSCWGDNTFQQAGSGDGGVVALPAPATGIALGDYHGCAITTANAVYCWGLDNAQQLGRSPSLALHDSPCGPYSAPCNGTPSVVQGLSAVTIAAAGDWTCAVNMDGGVQCWGAVQAPSPNDDPDAAMPCGSGTTLSGGTCYQGVYTVDGVGGVTELAVSLDHACAVFDAGSGSDAGNVLCWGKNDENQVASSFCPPANVCPPLTASAFPASAGVAVGTAFTCAPNEAGVACVGDNTYGELGHTPSTSNGDVFRDGGVYFNRTAQPVQGLGAASALVAGGTAACAIAGGTVVCWGSVVGADAGTPVAIGGLPPNGMTALGAPDDAYVCGEASDGGGWCWTLWGGAVERRY